MYGMGIHRLLLVVWVCSLAVRAAAEPAGATVDFQREVRPILSDACFQCHGPDPSTRLAGLRLDQQDAAFGKRETGTPIVPGDVDASAVYQRITHSDPVRRMPPEYSNKKLEPEQIGLIRNWIEQGADWNEHWSFRTPTRPQTPAVKNEAWARNPVDRFILARLDQEGLEPAPEADKRTLARRASLDVTGLPPTPNQVEQYLNDDSPDAYERYVDRLLQSEAYGEHRARYWLDAARYGDTHGIHIDNYREMWPYRDWVIEAFNDNKPFDEFTIEQLAGDLLPDPTLEQLVATGFQRCNITTNEGGVIAEEYEVVYAKDRADTIGTVYLGLTVGCATCHDHKFDPIPQKDFYSLTAFFRNTTQHVMDGNISDPPPIVIVPQDEDRGRFDELRKKFAATQAKIKDAPESDGPFERWLASGEYRSLATPVEESAEMMTLRVDDEVDLLNRGNQQTITLPPGVETHAAKEAVGPALRFEKESWLELPASSIDGSEPFSLTAWVFHPEKNGNFVVASQTDPEDEMRGWSLSIGARQINFKMTSVDDDGDPASIDIAPNSQNQLEPGTWAHIAVSYDGTEERAGLDFYLNGENVFSRGSEHFKMLKSSIRNDRPIQIGRGYVEIRDEHVPRYFAGGAIADFRLLNRAISVDEARVLSGWQALQQATTKQAASMTAEERKTLHDYYLTQKDVDYRRLASAKTEIEREVREIRRRGGSTHVMQEMQGSEAAAHVLNRGMYDQREDAVKAKTPSALPAMPATYPRNRMGLAKWLVDESNPMTARVTVNRYWQELFGTGIVKTSDDFGSQGEQPSHPKLLDWLAVEFREKNWNVKGFLRTLLTSATYRQSAETTPAKIEKDPQNRLVSRGPRFRMDAEMVRDYALSASGLLVSKIGGPSVKPYQPPRVWETVAMRQSNTRFYKQDKGDKLYRRSLYTFWKRAAPPASMQIFNAPSREHSTVRRERTNTPLQALVTMNDPQFVEAARHLAQNAMRESGDSFDDRLGYITARLLSRPFDAKESAVAERSYERLVDYYRSHNGARDLLATGDSSPDHSLPAAESAALTMLANQIMNLDEVLNK